MALFLRFLLGALMLVGTQAAMLQFGSMVKHITKRPPLNSFAFYGCYCGLGGGGWPVDEIDWCCHAHDCCYGDLISQHCSPYGQRYNFTRIEDDITCEDEDLTGCARESCECDREIAHCFKQFDRQYSRKNNRNYARKNCDGESPPC
ncbi:Group IIF secretory phospholipase A2, partial [Pristimantis euphronides]